MVEVQLSTTLLRKAAALVTVYGGNACGVALSVAVRGWETGDRGMIQDGLYLLEAVLALSEPRNHLTV